MTNNGGAVLTTGDGAVLTIGDGAVLTWGRFDRTPSYAFVSVRILIAKIAIKLKSIGHVNAFKIDFVLRLSTRFYTLLL